MPLIFIQKSVNKKEKKELLAFLGLFLSEQLLPIKHPNMKVKLEHLSVHLKTEEIQHAKSEQVPISLNTWQEIVCLFYLPI